MGSTESQAFLASTWLGAGSVGHWIDGAVRAPGAAERQVDVYNPATGAVARTVAEKAATGGEISISSTGSVIQRRNAEIDAPADVSVSINPSGWPADSPSPVQVEPTEMYPNYVRLHLSGAQQFSTGNELISVSSGRSMSMGS
jgi:hypothetical protein